ncbi:hypothetical protein BDB00DRAFT_791744 [Zychaea mexicana]|uniref:uncharacterized protein n=1 Tax=Zychaea mexicana TaxID=64656 RepID=UPI0022FED5A1|nr:uncharacterized protein BDB00DRAFT_791744 [Zychaea mexicana]KAI9488578.1 hypothetical protein BDB00DRAFT_791744 [Zychaea mexicana]
MTIDLSGNPLIELQDALSRHNYGAMVQLASEAIDDIRRLQLVAILDHRAYALGMNSKFHAAISDAETMITFGPTMATGYLRLGDLLVMQGKLSRAAEIYEEALNRVPKSDPAYARLMKHKIATTKKNEHRFDFVAALPLEIHDDIITYLPERERSMLLDVSTTWRKRITCCPQAWAKITNNGNDGVADAMVTRVLPYVAEHIRDLTIDTADEEVWLRYLNHIANGDFKNITTLKIIESTSGDALKALVKWCPDLRRLSLYNCTPSVLDIVYECCANLELFGYDSDFAIPELDELHRDKYPNGPGLRGIYTPNGETGVPADKFMRLLRKNAKTLERIYANISTSEQEQSNTHLQTRYRPNSGELLKFERLEEFMYRIDTDKVFEPLFLKSIEESCNCNEKTLALFHTVNSSRLSSVVDTLLLIPPVEALNFSWISSDDEDEDNRRLIQLLKTYAALPEANQKLTKVRLHNNALLTDEVLVALAELKTIEDIEIYGDSKITSQGLILFLTRASEHARIIKVGLSEVDAVDDDILREEEEEEIDDDFSGFHPFD